MPDRLHVILTDYGRFGWGVTSPQLPGFIGGRDSRDDLLKDLDDLLEFAGASANSQRLIHVEQHMTLEATQDELIVRLAQDEHLDERAEVFQSVVAALRLTSQFSRMMDRPRRPTGEMLFVCAVASDTIEWLIEQMEENDSLCVVLDTGGDTIRTQFFGRGDAPTGEPGWTRVSDMGWNGDTTLGEIIKAQDSGQVSSRQLVHS